MQKNKKLLFYIIMFISLVFLSACTPREETVGQEHQNESGEVEHIYDNNVTPTPNITEEPEVPDSDNTTENSGQTDEHEQIGEGNGETDDVKRAEELLAQMSLEEKVGQIFVARLPEKEAVGKAEKFQLGGYILFSRDFEGKAKEEIIQEISNYQSVMKIPMLIGVDEEGGIVNRVSRYPELRSEPFQSPQELYHSGGWKAVRDDTMEKSKFLKSFGINFNFAPVSDVSTNPEDFIYERSFGQDANETAKYVVTVVQGMSEQNMGSVLKHFPGYGNNVDTHTGVAYDERSYHSFVESDFIPFQAGIDAGANVVMVSHNVVKSMDSEYPASISPEVHRILREELGFSGVIITDDLVMDGVKAYASDKQIAVVAIQAGNDMLCCTNFEEQISAVIEAVKQGELSEQQIDESVLRVLKMKLSLGILN